MGVDVGRHLRLQGDREHLPRSLAHDLIEHEPLASLGSASSWTTLSMGVFPTGAPTPAHDQTCYGLSIFFGKVRPFTSPRRGPSTGSDHCSRRLAPAVFASRCIRLASAAMLTPAKAYCRSPSNDESEPDFLFRCYSNPGL